MEIILKEPYGSREEYRPYTRNIELISLLQALQNGFYDIAAFPFCVGSIDGTLISVLAPKDNKAVYVDRYQNHSLNVQGMFKSGLSLQG